MNGKGNKPRPFSVSQEEYATRWDAIFGRDLKEDESEKENSQNDVKETEEEKNE